MNVENLKAGFPVVTAPRIEELAGNGITTEQLRNRQPATAGVVKDAILDHRGEVWLVQHSSDGKVAAYHHDELVSFTTGSMPTGFRPGE
jgi:hypothetical protein